MDLELIFKGAPSACIILKADSPAFTIVRVNDAYNRVTNTTEQELVTKSMLEAFPWIFHTGGQEAVIQLAESLRRVVNTKLPQKLACRIQKTSLPGVQPESTRYLELNNAPVLNGQGEVAFIIQTITDITQQSKAEEKGRLLEEEVLENQEQFRYLFENNPNGLYSIDPEGKLLNANSSLLQLLGCSREELAQQSLLHYVVPEEQQKVLDYIQKARMGETNHFHCQLITAQGQPLVAHISHFPIIVKNRKKGIYGIVQDVTAQVQTTRELEEREHQLNTIYNSVGDAIFVLDIEPQNQYKFSSVNPAFLQVTGFTRDQVVGQYLSDVLSESPLIRSISKYQEAIREKKEVRWEGTADYPNGRRTVEVKVSPVFDAQGQAIRLVGVFHDLTRRKEAEMALATSEQIYKSLFDHNPDAVYSLDLAGNFMSANEKVADLTGIPVAELLGTPFAPLIAPQDLERVNLHFQKAVAGAYQHYETGIITAHNNYLIVSVTKLPILVNGSIIGVYGIAKDITADRESAARQQMLTEDLYRQNQDLQQFTYIVSHNLRAPVANTLGLVELLINREEQDELTPMALTHMQDSLRQLDLVLKELNMILSLRDNKAPVQLEEVDLGLQCQQVVRDLRRILAEAEGSIEWHIPPGTVVWANKAYLNSILHNLLANAIKYRAPDRKLRIILASTGNTPRGVTFTVSDNGIGMDLKRVGKKIFKLYSRFHAQYEGRGIGLFLVKSHVEAMGGHIEVSSQQDAGTTFKIHLPPFKPS